MISVEASSPLNVSIERYLELKYLVPFIDYSFSKSIVESNISDGLFTNHMINKIGLTKLALYAYNSYIRTFWTAYYKTPKLLYYYTTLFYNTYKSFGEYYPFFKAKEWQPTSELEIATKYLILSCYSNKVLENNVQIKHAKPDKPFSINRNVFRSQQTNLNEFYCLVEFDTRVGINNIFGSLIYAHLKEQGIQRYYNYYDKFSEINNYKLLFQSSDKIDLPKWERTEFMNGQYIYTNYT